MPLIKNHGRQFQIQSQRLQRHYAAFHLPPSFCVAEGNWEKKITLVNTGDKREQKTTGIACFLPLHKPINMEFN